MSPASGSKPILLKPELAKWDAVATGGDIITPQMQATHGVTAFQLAVEDQLSQKQGADPVARAVGTHVNRVFDCKTISIAGAEIVMR